MAQFFICYRRRDTAYAALSLCQALQAGFGKDAVFIDVDSIPLGVDFRQHIRDILARCDAVLVLIGDRWLEAGPGVDASHRLADPHDFVRLEIATALASAIPVVPVLVGDARMPVAADLPIELRDLAYRQAAELRPGRDYIVHLERLVAGLKRLTGGGSPAARPVTSPDPHAIGSMRLQCVPVPAGEFLMGSPDSDKDADDYEKPQHRVRISRPFYLGVHPVTQGEYERVTGANPSHFSARARGEDQVVGQDTGRFPVESVSWFDAVTFCNKLSEREGLTTYYRISGQDVTTTGSEGYRLPTEAEWEYACRAGTTTKYSFGDDAAELGDYAWFDGNAEGTPHAVGQRRPNGFGLYDMHGNVWEWCWDGYEGYQGSPAVDPSGPLQATVRVSRGGCWCNFPRSCRSAYRYGFAPDYRNYFLGFRVARDQSGR